MSIRIARFGEGGPRRSNFSGLVVAATSAIPNCYRVPELAKINRRTSPSRPQFVIPYRPRVCTASVMPRRESPRTCHPPSPCVRILQNVQKSREVGDRKFRRLAVRVYRHSSPERARENAADPHALPTIRRRSRTTIQVLDETTSCAPRFEELSADVDDRLPVRNAVTDSS